MHKLKLFCFCLLLFATKSSFAQVYQKSNSALVFVNGNALQMAWAGGMNAPEFQTIDLNGDSIKDLVLFEKQANAPFAGYVRISTFINTGTPNQVSYVYSPQYISAFPNTLHDWMLLVDYDCDGREDIFSYSSAGGIEVYHNDYTASNGLSFSLAYPLLYATFLASIYDPINPTAVNQPALVDVNNDGDLDILNFSTTGGTIQYFENFAMENYGRCDTLVMRQLKECWGQMQLNAFSNSAQVNACNNFQDSTTLQYRMKHSGSCMVAFDKGADNDIDLINGDLLGNNLLYLQNGTFPFAPDWINAQDSTFPAYNVPVNYVTFPAPYLVDVDNDGDKDLIVSSCSDNQSENYNNILYYQNTTNNTSYVLNFVKSRFLVDQMIDVGSGANPALVDVDGDGLTDMLIGNYGFFQSQTPANFLSGIYYFHNTGTAACPQFELADSNFANIQSLGLTGVYPTFADYDGDGDLDMVCGATDGMLYYFNNNAGAGNPMNLTLAANGINWQGIDVGFASLPQAVDVDMDGLTDILIGTGLGKIWYYRNTGTASAPAFTLASTFFGGINLGVLALGFYGYASPILFTENGIQKLLVGSLNGRLALYDNITGNLNGNFNLVTDSAYGVLEPYRSTIARADLNNDGLPELIVGCYAGGVAFYSQTLPCLTSVEENTSNSNQFLLYPNPTDKVLTIEKNNKSNSQSLLLMYDVLGNVVYQATLSTSKSSINTSVFDKGVYLVKIISGEHVQTSKVILK